MGGDFDVTVSYRIVLPLFLPGESEVTKKR